MKRVVCGSQALKFWNRLTRKPSDWDLLWESPKTFTKVGDQIIDANSFHDESTNLELAKRSQQNPEIDTPVGKAVVMGLKEIKIMKLASLCLEKNKNLQDLKVMEDIVLDEADLELVERRKKDTENKKNREQFFNKYAINRFFDHDQLHHFLNSSPAYLKILKNNSLHEVCEEKFAKLDLVAKIELIREEVFVLALERFLVPRIIANPLRVNHFCNVFFKVEKSSDPAIYWLDRFCSNLQDNPLFLKEWARSNYFLIMNRFSPWWEEKFDNLSEDFWIKLGVSE